MGEFKDRGEVIEKETIDHVLATTHQEIVEEVKSELEDQEMVQHQLNIKLDAGKQTGKEPSRVKLCADYVRDIFQPRLYAIRRSKDPVLRAYVRDIREGFSRALGDLIDAELFISRGEEILSTPAKDNVEGQRLYAQNLERLTKLKDFLIQDRTGISILRNNVELLKQGILPESMLGIHHLPFALAGAQLAYDLYTQVYPLSQNLPDATYRS